MHRRFTAIRANEVVALPRHQPCAFLAGAWTRTSHNLHNGLTLSRPAVDYIILGRLSAHLDGHRHLKPFSPRFLTRIFVGSDIVTFCIQAAGGGLSTSQNPASRKAGGNIFLAGLALQLVSFAGFTGLYVAFGWRM